jgi:hypothetical protein
MALKDRLIRLGNNNPNLRKHLRPVLDRLARTSRLEKVEKDLLNAASGLIDITNSHTNPQAREAVVKGRLDGSSESPTEVELERDLTRMLEPYVDLSARKVYDDYSDQHIVILTAEI